MHKEDLRIVFMGTPEFAVETLQALVENEYNVVAVVTQPDKPVGRHQTEMQPSAVKQYAVANGLPVLQPEKMKDPEFVEQLRSYNANLQVVVAFRMLPEVVWAMPEYGTFNVHAALLPQYRGAAPINWAVINGETETGVTTFFLDQLCLETLEAIVAADGHPDSIPQDDSQFSILNSQLKSAPKIFKETCQIDWTKTAKQVYDFVRGLSPYPGAWTTLVGNDKETVLKIYKTRKTGSATDQKPGTLRVEQKALQVAAGDEWLEIVELQMAGKKRMTARDFLNGIKIENFFVR